MSQDTFSTLLALLDETGAAPTRKTASEEPSGNGATGSDTSHPTKNDDAGTTANPTGELLASDTKELADQNPLHAQGQPAPTDTPQESVEMELGISRSGVGRDPANERDPLHDSLPEPGVGTQHPAKFDDGQKYASTRDAQLALLSKQANDLLAEIVAASSPTTPAPAPANEQPRKVAEELLAAAQAGYKTADTALQHRKEAAVEFVQHTIHDALFDADLVLAHLHKVASEAEMGETPPEADEPAAGSTTAPAGDANANKPGDGDDSGAPGESELSAALEAAPGDESVSPDAAVQEMAMALQELGITPERLLEIVAQASQGGAGGMPPDAGMPPEGGMPPDAGVGGAVPGGMPPGVDMPKMARARLVASRVSYHKRAGHFRIEPTKNASQRQLRDRCKAMLIEMVGTNR